MSWSVILSAAPALLFRPAYCAGRAGAESKDLRFTNWVFLLSEGKNARPLDCIIHGLECHPERSARVVVPTRVLCGSGGRGVEGPWVYEFSLLGRKNASSLDSGRQTAASLAMTRW